METGELATKIPKSETASTGPERRRPMMKIAMVASIAAGIQFGWALQLSLLTPYVQLLGIPHTWAAYIWLCGPISGMVVQPIVGYKSDRCTSRFGRRRPFIAVGAVFVAIAVFLIGFAADLGHMSGDNLAKTSKPRAIAVFVVGFWVLDVANNMLQGPCRAFLADLSGDSQQKMRTANSLYSFFMAVGNVLGYAAGSYNHLYKLVPFSKTAACDVYCANLKTCFFISITLLLVLTIAALTYVKETPWSPERKAEEDEDPKEGGIPCTGQLVEALKDLKKPMRILLLVTCLNWIAWFPFLLFDTDWMGREVYGGVSKGDARQVRLYDRGVHAGALGLMLNSVVLGFVSLGVEVTGRWMGGTKKLWGLVNVILAVCLAMTVLITKLAESHRRNDDQQFSLPPGGIRAAALVLFSILGIPLARAYSVLLEVRAYNSGVSAVWGPTPTHSYGRIRPILDIFGCFTVCRFPAFKVTYSVPFALASIFSNTSGAGQGLSLGILNLSIVVPQMLVSVASGPFDALFGGGNLPAFVVGAIAALASGIFALTLLPSPPPEVSTAKTSQPLTAFH